jgi:hypothetical protein
MAMDFKLESVISTLPADKNMVASQEKFEHCKETPWTKKYVKNISSTATGLITGMDAGGTVWIKHVINTGLFMLRSCEWSKHLLQWSMRQEYDFGADNWGAPRGEQGNVNVVLYGWRGALGKVLVQDFDHSFHCPLCVTPQEASKCFAFHTMRYWGYDQGGACTQEEAFQLATKDPALARFHCCNTFKKWACSKRRGRIFQRCALRPTPYALRC